MAGDGRNDQCSCGSGRKVKRCCGQVRGPNEVDLARAYLAGQRRVAARSVLGLPEDELEDLWEAISTLPEVDLSLQVRFPRLHGSEVEATAAAFDAADAHAAGRALVPLVRRLDTPLLRAGLVRAVLALRDRGDVDPELAAVAVVDLASDSSRFLRASVVRAVAVEMGAEPTPSGLLVASA